MSGTTFYNNSHSVFSLHYHLILVVKYRRNVIDARISERLKELFTHVGEPHHITIEEWNHDRDHIHVLFRCSPETYFPDFLRSYKSASSRIIKHEFPDIRNSLWKEMFWSPSYYLLTTGGVTIQTIMQYIQSQGKPHNHGGKP